MHLVIPDRAARNKGNNSTQVYFGEATSFLGVPHRNMGDWLFTGAWMIQRQSSRDAVQAILAFASYPCG